jgi:hypothetical protein
MKSLKILTTLIGYLTISIYSTTVFATYRSPKIDNICASKVTEAVSKYALDNGYINSLVTNGTLFKSLQLSGGAQYYSSLSDFTTDLNLKNIDGKACTHLYFKVYIRDHSANTNSACDFTILNNPANPKLFYCL